MALSVPSTPTVKTKTYENFKGVDLTNDSTNVWYRRSPSGVNMLPDASGRPFKRKGWEIVKTSSDLRKAHVISESTATVTGSQSLGTITVNKNKFLLYVDESGSYTMTYSALESGEYAWTSTWYQGEIILENFGINYSGTASANDTITVTATMPTKIGNYEIDKCYYFTISGISCLAIFSTNGFFLFKEDELTYLGNDTDLVQSFDRAFFFEGNGKSAFYVYGGRKVWMVDETFTLKSLEQKLTGDEEIKIPRILITTDASTGAGEIYESYNLLGSKVAVEYSGNMMCFAETNAENVSVNVNETTFVTKTSATRTPSKTIWVFTNASGGWKIDGVAISGTLADYGISYIGTIDTDETITVHYAYGVLIPQIIDATNTADNPITDRIKVEVSTLTKFDTPLTVTTDAVASAGKCSVKTSAERSWIEFEKQYSPLVDGEDAIKVTYPSVIVTVTDVEDLTKSVTASLDRGNS